MLFLLEIRIVLLHSNKYSINKNGLYIARFICLLSISSSCLVRELPLCPQGTSYLRELQAKSKD